jgi:hypothetical protein
MGTFDDAWRKATLKKQCKYCGDEAVKWKGGTYYCRKCYEQVVVKRIDKEISAPPYRRGGGSEISEHQGKRKKPRKINISKYKFIK